jgi:hypothetical protein
MIRILAAIFFIFQLIQVVLANDELEGIDKARVFPVQKNNTVIHSASKNEEDANANQLTLPASSPANKSSPKDTSLLINGNGGSTNRAAGGNASLRKRFTFD